MAETADFTPIMVGDRELFDSGRDDAETARKLFPNQGLHAAAASFAVAHKRAIQYLEQAPVLVFGAVAGGPGGRRINHLYMAHKLTPLCERGVKLSEMMRAFDMPLPMRRLRASALSPSVGLTCMALGRLAPEVLGRIVPDRAKKQRQWLLAMTRWRERMIGHRKPADTRFAWAAEAVSIAGVRTTDVGDVVDFAATDEPFNEAWKWPRAVEECELWHDRLNAGRAVSRLQIRDDMQIDLKPHPDRLDVGAYSFHALRTPGEIIAEGRAMRHCVASYIPIVMRGDCHIVSVREARARAATLELDRAWRVAQLKGRFNAAPPRKLADAAQEYAIELRRIAEERRGART